MKIDASAVLDTNKGNRCCKPFGVSLFSMSVSLSLSLITSFFSTFRTILA